MLLTGAFGTPESTTGTISHAKHRQRRAPLNKFFSRASITRLEPLIQSAVDTLCARLRDFQREEKVAVLNLAWSCFTNDVVSEYAFGKSYNYLENSHDFHTDIHDALCNVGDMFHVLRTIPWVIGPMQKLPRWIVKLLDPKTLSFLNFQRDIASQIKAIITGSDEHYNSSTQPSIFHEILNSSLPPEEKLHDRLWQEGQTIIGAGTETTAWALTLTTVHVLSNPSIRQKLLEELRQLFELTGERPTFNQLEQLPYLGAVISEGLRLSHGVTTHLQRVSPDSALTFNSWQIPPGTPVSMSAILIHQNPDIFPDPQAFRPDRWLTTRSLNLKRYLVSFSKGSRQCLGMNLAYAELYLGLAYVLWRFPRAELVAGTALDDVEVVADYFIPVPRKRGRHVGVLL